MQRVTSDFFVAAYLRRRNAEGRFTAVVRKGAAEAGAIFVKVSRLDGTADLYGPLPQMFTTDLDPAIAGGRVFERLSMGAPDRDVEDRLTRERVFDTDCWVVETEARDGDHGLDVLEI